MAIYILKIWEVKNEGRWVAFQRERTARMFAINIFGKNRPVRVNYIECPMIDGNVVIPNTVSQW